ncbi:ExbD/TolR family protein [Dysgonomonas reticulitermitis]|nr:biopolymer transporter ExbD [Bacteroidia bacterium]
MGKTKVKKNSTFIDMTAMSDVTVLLLTFFMLTATFLPKEPVQVQTPQSVSETKVPDYNVLNILVDPSGKVFLNIEPADKRKQDLLEAMGKDFGVTFTPKQIRSFMDQTHIGVPMNRMSAFLDLSLSEQDAEIKKWGVPIDSVNDQFSRWVKHAREISEDMGIAIKADQTTQFPLVDVVMKRLVTIKENRYSLVTSLKAMPDV